jgi:predicted Zn-dependent peptidase
MFRSRRARGAARGPRALALSLALAAACAPAQAPGPAHPAATAFAVAPRYDLRAPSGLRLIYEQRPSSHLATVTTEVEAGQRYDPEGREGTAHLVQELTFRAREARAARLGLDLNAEGIRSDAEVGLDTATYMAAAPARGLPLMLDAELARLAEPLAGVDGETLEVVRTVAINDLRQRTETDFFGTAWRWLYHDVFPAPHPYARLESRETLSAITLDEARAWSQRHYRPERATIVVTGPWPIAEAQSLITRLLPPALSGDPGRPVSAPARGAESGPPLETAGQHPLVRRRGDVSEPELLVGWSGPGARDPHTIPLTYWSWFVSKHLTASDLRDDDVKRFTCSVSGDRLASLFWCRLSLIHGSHPEASAQHLFELLPRSSGELAHSVPGLRGALEVSFGARRETSPAAGRLRAFLAHETGEADDDDWVQRTLTVTPDEVTRSVETTLAPARAHLVLIEPAPREPTFGPVAFTARPPIKTPRTPQARQNVLAELGHTHFLEGLVTATLPNGLLVAALPRHGAPIVEATLAFRVGESPRDHEIVEVARDAFKPQFATPPEVLGLQVDPSFREHAAHITALGASRNVDQVIESAARAARHYEVEWPSRKFLTERVPSWRQALAEPDARAGAQFLQLVSPEHHPPELASPERLAQIPRAEIVDWLARTLRPENGLLVVAGEIDTAHAIEAARRALGDWQGSGQPAPPPTTLAPAPPPPAASGGAWPAPIVIARAGASQVAVTLGCRLPVSDAARDAMNDLLASIVRNDIAFELEAKTGATRGVTAYARVFPGGSAYLHVKTLIGNDQLAQSLGSLREFWGEGGEASRIAGLSYAQIFLSTSRLFEYESSSTLVRRLVSTWNLGWSFERIDRYSDFVAAVSLDAAKAWLRDCSQHLVVTLVGDPNVIAAATAR